MRVGGDQGLLNLYFSDWATKDISKRLPFVYNVVGHSFYSYLPAFAKSVYPVAIITLIKCLNLCINRVVNEQINK